LWRSWPTEAGHEYTMTLGDRPLLLVAEPIVDLAGGRRGMVVVGVDADYLAQEAMATAWILLAIAYAMLIVVGWSSWQQLNSSLGARIHAITSQIRKGSADEPIETLKIDGQELRELADSVSAYIK